MPKIIVNARQKLIDEARKQATENGYSSLNIRTVAKNCDISVGTVYNYFPSKDALVAEFLNSDWEEHMQEFHAAVAAGAPIRSVVESIYRELRNFQTRYTGVFQALTPKMTKSKKTYHTTLRDQLADCVKPYCHDMFTARFIAESLIVWSVEGASFRKLASTIEKIVA